MTEAPRAWGPRRRIKNVLEALYLDGMGKDWGVRPPGTAFLFEQTTAGSGAVTARGRTPTILPRGSDYTKCYRSRTTAQQPSQMHGSNARLTALPANGLKELPS